MTSNFRSNLVGAARLACVRTNINPPREIHPMVRSTHCAATVRVLTQVIKRFIMSSKKTAFIVEHDFIMAAYLADRVIVYEGQPSVEVKADSLVVCT